MLNPKKKPKIGRPSKRQLYLDKLEEYDDQIILQMCKKAAEGDAQMIKLWHQYRMGNPTTIKEEDDISSEGIDLIDLLGTTFKDEANDLDDDNFFEED